MIVIPLPLLEKKTGSTGGWGKDPFPSPAAASQASLSSCPPLGLPVRGTRDIYLPVSTVAQVKKLLSHGMVLMPLILGKQADGRWPANLWRPFEMAQPSSLTGCRLKPSQLSAGHLRSQTTSKVQCLQTTAKCSASKTFGTCSGKNCMGRPAGCPAKP